MEQALKPKRGFFYGYLIVVASFGIWAFGWGSYTTWSVFFKPLLDDFGWSRAATMGANSFGAIIMGVFAIVAGRMTDRFGPRKVVLILGTILSIGYFLMSQVNNLWELYLFQGILIGIGQGAVFSPAMASIARWFQKRRAFMTSLVTAGQGLGSMAMAPLAAEGIIRYGWRDTYIILSVVVFISMIACALLLRRDPAEMGLLPYGAEPGVKGASAAKKMQSGGFTLRDALHTWQFWILFFIIFIIGFGRSPMSHLPAHMTDLGFSLTAAAAVTSIQSAVMFFGRFFGGALDDRIGSRKSLMFNFALMAASVVFLIFSDQLWMFYVFSAVFGLSNGALACVRITAVPQIFGLASVGAIMGVTELSMAASGGFGTYFVGWLFDASQSYFSAFIISIVCLLAGIVLSWRLKPIKKGDKL